MRHRPPNPTERSLSLPAEFEDLTGLIQSDLKVIVTVLTQRASERHMLSRRQTQQFRRELWNRLVESVEGAVEPLVVERH